MAKKNLIIDTNVFLSDSECFTRFQNNDLFIPIKVLEELDKHKTRQTQPNTENDKHTNTTNTCSSDTNCATMRPKKLNCGASASPSSLGGALGS